MKSRATQVVYGPGTFLNRAVAAVNTQIGAMLDRRPASDAGGRGAGLPARHRQGA